MAMRVGEDSVDVSVIIVSWNVRDLLVQCVQSVQREARSAGLHVEIIVVDNASTDDTVEHLRREQPPITLIALNENQGFAAANNIGIKRSTGNAVLLLNPDTDLLPGSLSALWRTLHAAPHVGVVGARLLNPDGSLQSAGYRFPDLVQVFLDFFPVHPRLGESSLNGRFSVGDGVSPYEIDHPLGACMLVRRTVIDHVGALDEDFFMYSEEVDWCRRIKAAGWTILAAPSAQIIHHGGQSTGQISDTMFIELHRSRARYYRRYHSDRFIRTTELMARAAAWYAGCHGPGKAARAEALKTAGNSYREVTQSDD